MYRWKQIDSSAFNQPGMDEAKDYHHGSYIPQYAAAKVHKQVELAMEGEADAHDLHQPVLDPPTTPERSYSGPL
jgi:hypothetical protein